ncbi:MAG: M42 family peptidase [Chloroflexota bacterium]
MTDISPFLKSLLSAPGLTGHESPVARLIEERWRTLADEVSLSRLGSVHALMRGSAAAPRPSLLISAHMDAIGLMVAGISGEFLRLSALGGIDARVLPGAPVLVHGRKPLPGIIVQPPARLLPESSADEVIGLEHLLVDVGLTAAQAARQVRVGDLVSFANEPVELSGETLSGHSIDNRVSVAALTLCLEALQAGVHAWDVWAVAAVQEELTFAGGVTSAFTLRPSLAVVVDTTFGKGPGASGWDAFPIGKGLTLGIGPSIHPFLHAKFKELAERLEIPVAVEPMPTFSGTEADGLQVAAQGVPTMVLSIPIRYMHTPVEVVAIKDIQRAGRLLAEFAAGLEEDFLEKVVWDD